MNKMLINSYKNTQLYKIFSADTEKFLYKPSGVTRHLKPCGIGIWPKKYPTNNNLYDPL